MSGSRLSAAQKEDHCWPGPVRPVRPRRESLDLGENHMSGLLKLRINGKWKQSWWVLKDHVLYRYEAMNNPSAKETFPVLGWTLETLSDVS